jgi:sensor histidine kinase YesM
VLAAGWIVVGTLSFVRHLVAAPGSDESVLARYALSLACYLPWTALGPAVVAVERRFPLGGSRWAWHFLVLAAASVPFTYAAAVAAAGLTAGTTVVFGLERQLPRIAWMLSAGEWVGDGLMYWSSAGAACMLRLLGQARENERRAARLMLEKSQLEASLRQAELDALRMRLQPHFLFNSIQNISVLIEHNPQTASRMLTRLGELLRASLGRDGRAETTLQAEIALTTAYLSVEQMRFGDRLSYLVDVGHGTERALVPTFLLQPLAENAIRHGLQRVRDGGVIVIRSRDEGGSLVVTVTDNGAGPSNGGLPGTGLGIGLGATRERLARMFPGEHTFGMQAVPEGGTEVRITLPLRFEAVEEVPDRGDIASVDRR